jgi:hypothetical protein
MRFGIVFMAFILFISCKDKNEAEPETTEYMVPDTILAWDINADSMIMKRDSAIPDSAITISRIMNGLNDKYPDVHIVFVRQSADTIYTTVPDAEHLGEQMGDAGASAWFADAVINLTSVPGINYVSFDMDLHSHAGGGVISRKKYNDWKKE